MPQLNLSLNLSNSKTESSNFIEPTKLIEFDNITPFEDGNDYEINLNNIELYEFDNFNKQLEHNTEQQNVETIVCEEKSSQSIEEETLNTPSTIISPINENKNDEYKEDMHNNLENYGRKQIQILGAEMKLKSKDLKENHTLGTVEKKKVIP